MRKRKGDTEEEEDGEREREGDRGRADGEMESEPEMVRHMRGRERQSWGRLEGSRTGCLDDLSAPRRMFGSAPPAPRVPVLLPQQIQRLPEPLLYPPLYTLRGSPAHAENRAKRPF